MRCADHNRLASLTAPTPLNRLRVLRLCNNPIAAFDATAFPQLRTLFLDNAKLGTVHSLDKLHKLENFSIRDQAGHKLLAHLLLCLLGLTSAFRNRHLPCHSIRDVRRLYLSGNALPRSFPTDQYFNLVYLELAACKLTALPTGFAASIPNCRTLNLNHNFLSDLEPLLGLRRLVRLSIVGSRLEKCKPFAKVVGTMGELKSLDLRCDSCPNAYLLD